MLGRALYVVVRGMAVGGCSTAEALSKHGQPHLATCKAKYKFARVRAREKNGKLPRLTAAASRL